MDEREQLEQAIANIEKQRALLGDAVVDSAISAMRAKIESLAPAPQPAPQQRKQVTVLFADVSGFTAMSETMDHEDVSMVMNSLWTRVDNVIVEHGGRVDKHIGDAVMAIFGVPTAREDDAERAVRTALDIHSAIESWKQEFSGSDTVLKARVEKPRLRIGVNTGPALIGSVGTTAEYTAIGDTVNLASRVETAAPVGSTLISHNTYRHVRGIFEVTGLEPITVKGKAEPIQVYLVHAVKPHSFRMTTRGVEGIETRTVGREQELARLQSVFEAAASEKRTRLVSVVAEAGTGKSRLLHELTERLELRPEPVQMFRSRSIAEMEKVPYSTLKALLSTAFDIQDGDRAAVAHEKLERGLQRPESDPGDQAAAHFVGQLIGFDYSTSPHLRGILGDARQIRDMAFHHLAEYFAALAEAAPVVIYLDDVHWADTASLEWVDFMLSHYPGLRLLFVCLMRPAFFEHHRDWESASAQRLRLDLQPLADDQCRALVREILQKAPEVPAALVDLVVQKAEGSPFYIEELIKVLIEGGVIVPGDPEWIIQMGKLQTLTVPATLAAVLQARLDSLVARDREILQQASVVGRIFWPNVLAHMRNAAVESIEADPALQHSLHTLRAKELIFENEASTFADVSEYIFRHAVFHDVTYESVLLRLRRVYHRQVAEGLIWLSDERVGEYAGRVGEHYELAGEPEQAARWYLRAGKQAQDTYAPEAAANYYQKALGFFQDAAAQDNERELEAFNHLGEVLVWQARYGEAIENYKSMLRAAIEKKDTLSEVQALLGLALASTQQGDHREAQQHARRAEELARHVHAEAQVARSLWAQGAAGYYLGDGQRALAHAEQALAINSKLDNRTEMARCLNLLAAAHYSLGDYRQAEQHMESALALFRELGDRRQGMDVLNNLGVIADARGDYNAAFLRYHSALEIAREMGYRDGEIVFLSNRGSVQSALGNYAAAEQDLCRAIELAGAGGSWILPKTQFELSEASLRLGKTEQAMQAAGIALELGTADGSPEYVGAAYRALAMISRELHQPLPLPSSDAAEPRIWSAEMLFAESLRILEEGKVDGERARTLREWARYELRDGHTESGVRMWTQARDLFSELGAEMEVRRMAQMPS